MNELGSYLFKNLNTARFERKFLMSMGQSYESNLILNSNAFKKSFPDRRVCSFYYDTIDFDALNENISGVNCRDKLRVRFYNFDLSLARIEIKHKRGDIGFKSVIDIEENILSEDMLKEYISNWCSIYIRKKLIPTAYIEYSRKYYERKWLRATIDSNIKAFRIVGSKFVPSAMRNYEVIEFKYPIEYDSAFRNLYREINWVYLRNTKSSKYSNALMF